VLAALLSLALAADPRCVEVLSISDLEGRAEEVRALATQVEDARARRDTVVVVAGDALFGTLEADLTGGRTVTAALDALGVAAATIGNDEFEHGWEPLRARIETTGFPWLAANLREGGTGALPRWRNLRSGAIVTTRSGLDVGIVGIAASNTREVVLPERVWGIEFGDEVAAAQVTARTLRRDGADVVIVIAHLGGACPSGATDASVCEDSPLFRLARATRGLVDGVVGAHTRSVLSVDVDGVAVVQGPPRGAGLGRMTLCERLAPAPAVALEPGAGGDAPEARGDPPPRGTLAAMVDAAIRPFFALARDEAGKGVGVTLPAPLAREDGEGSPLGLAAASALRHAGHADLALVSRASVGADLPAGEVTAGALYRAFPHRDAIVVLSLPGREVEELLSAIPADRIHLAGARPGDEGRVVRCGGEPLEPARTYRVALDERLAAGREGAARTLGAVPPARIELVKRTVREAVASWLSGAPGPRAAAACP
jgi:2',3'-cyclic-nucleotide 2'-phosphodiesterase (5'-nucleotidase family)